MQLKTEMFWLYKLADFFFLSHLLKKKCSRMFCSRKDGISFGLVLYQVTVNFHHSSLSSQYFVCVLSTLFFCLFFFQRSLLLFPLIRKDIVCIGSSVKALERHIAFVGPWKGHKSLLFYQPAEPVAAYGPPRNIML